jgi:hypothetical protein
MRRFVFLTVVALMMAVVLASPAWAETFTVDRIDDPDLSTTPTADDCTAAAANDCSLRGAITAANANAGDDTIDIGVTGTVDLTGALPNLSSNIEIKGPGADQLTVRRPATAATDFRIFNVTIGSVVSISGITISGGQATSDSGGGIQNSFGTLTVSDSTITDNSASFAGGGIQNSFGTLTVSNSTISHNSAGEGGGIDTVNNDTESQSTTITNSTISGNTSATSGGGVNNFSGRTTIKFSTITKNTANDRFGSGVASVGDNSARTEVLSTIISENTNTDVDFYSGTTNSFVSNGYNLIGDAGNDGNATGAFNQTGDQVATAADPINPMLGPLADNGGPTMTHALLTDSPAIDAGPPTDGDPIACPPPTTDQRGVSRPQGSACDIGTFELEQNAAPTVDVAAGGSCATNDRSGTINLTLDDPDGPEGSLILSAISNNTTLVPNANLTFGGSGASRTLTATAASGKTGTATVTVTVKDGAGATDTVTLTVVVDGNGSKTINGTAGADMIFGQNGNDALNGLDGNDLLCGGRGNDTFTGGDGADHFGGGQGTDTVTDFTPSQGDTKDNTEEVPEVVFLGAGHRGVEQLSHVRHTLERLHPHPVPVRSAPDRIVHASSLDAEIVQRFEQGVRVEVVPVHPPDVVVENLQRTARDHGLRHRPVDDDPASGPVVPGVAVDTAPDGRLSGDDGCRRRGRDAREDRDRIPEHLPHLGQRAEGRGVALPNGGPHDVRADADEYT